MANYTNVRFKMVAKKENFLACLVDVNVRKFKGLLLISPNDPHAELVITCPQFLCERNAILIWKKRDKIEIKHPWIGWMYYIARIYADELFGKPKYHSYKEWMEKYEDGTPDYVETMLTYVPEEYKGC